MADDKTTVPTSLSLRIGLGVFDGGDREWLAKTFSVSTDDVDHSWLRCREWLSKHFASADEREYTLLDEAALRERLQDSLRLLVDWRAQALHEERVAESLAKDPIDTSSDDDDPTPSDVTST